jgi:hypothetical protein
MKIGAIKKLYTRLLRRRNKAHHDHLRTGYSSLETEVSVLDKVLDDIDRTIANNHDRFHDRRQK